ncbi:MAG: hypothetical protein K2H90_06100 [Oscillospiraceae bacterium]|nr:hypothetical protein [Oscillospiraceae bacterium]
MSRFKKGFLRFGAAALSALMLSSCDTHTAEWDDTLPSPVTTSALPTVSIVTTETTTTEEITIPTRETTSRTAASSTTPELATTTNPPTDPIDGTTAVSTIPGVPRIPLSEFTSTTPSAITTDTSSLTEPPQSYSTAYDSGTASVTEGTVQVVTTLPDVADPFAPYTAREEIIRPYSYKMLDNEKYIYIYDAIVTAVDRRRTDITFSDVMGITADDYLAVYQQIYNDEINMFFIDPKIQYAIQSSTKTVASAVLIYKHSDAEITRMENAIEEEVNRVLEGVTPDMSQYDIVKYFHDYICENVVYDDKADNCNNIYGAFVNKRALCQGMAKAFSYLCGKVGIETLTVTGDADGIAHMWNMVKIGGEWYHIDPTYDNAESTAYGRYVRYDYFCLDDDTIYSKRNVYDQTYEYPRADSERCNYYVRNGLVGGDWDEIREILTEQVVQSAEERKVTAQVRCADAEVYDEAMDKLFGLSEKQAINIMNDALTMSDNKFRTDNISYAYDEGTRIITLYLDYTN